MAEIVMDGVSKRFGDGFEAVKDMNLEIADGEFMILVGPSGCGKSTALRMIAGLEDISDGEMRIGETVVNDMAPKDRDIAMVFQNYALYPHMTVRENMAFPLKLAKVPEDEITKKVEEAAAILVFIFAWNDFLFANTLTSTTNAQTVPAALAFFSGGSRFTEPIGAISAAAVVVTVPIIIMVLIFQRRIVAGLTAGAVKG